MVLMATNGKIPKDRSWKQAKIMMAKVDAFLDALITYDKEHIHNDVIKVNELNMLCELQIRPKIYQINAIVFFGVLYK